MRRSRVKPCALGRTGVGAAAGSVGAGAFWSLYVGLSLAILGNVVADGAPPEPGYVVLAAAVVLTAFWAVSAWTWVVVAATRLLVALRRRPPTGPSRRR
jgi:hypothetical protein